MRAPVLSSNIQDMNPRALDALKIGRLRLDSERLDPCAGYDREGASYRQCNKLSLRLLVDSLSPIPYVSGIAAFGYVKVLYYGTRRKCPTRYNNSI